MTTPSEFTIPYPLECCFRSRRPPSTKMTNSMSHFSISDSQLVPFWLPFHDVSTSLQFLSITVPFPVCILSFPLYCHASSILGAEQCLHPSRSLSEGNYFFLANDSLLFFYPSSSPPPQFPAPSAIAFYLSQKILIFPPSYLRSYS